MRDFKRYRAAWVVGAALALGPVACSRPSAQGSKVVRDTERRNERNPNVVNGRNADMENRAGQAINGDARATPNTAPPPIAPGDARGSNPPHTGGKHGSR